MKTKNIETEELSRSTTKFLSEYYLDRDWTDGRFFSEAQDELDREQKLLVGYNY